MTKTLIGTLFHGDRKSLSSCTTWEEKRGQAFKASSFWWPRGRFWVAFVCLWDTVPTVVNWWAVQSDQSFNWSIDARLQEQQPRVWKSEAISLSVFESSLRKPWLSLWWRRDTESFCLRCTTSGSGSPIASYIQYTYRTAIVSMCSFKHFRSNIPT